MNFPPEVERWRPIVAKYFPPHLVDKALWVIMYESGGNPGAIGDGGNAIGLFQIHHSGSIPGRPDAKTLLDPEANIRYAAQSLGAASGNWAAWGENNLYNGQPFGALGHHPFPGSGALPPAFGPGRNNSEGLPWLKRLMIAAGLQEMQPKGGIAFRHTGKGIAPAPGGSALPGIYPQEGEESSSRSPVPPPPGGLTKEDKKKRDEAANMIRFLDQQLDSSVLDPSVKPRLERERQYWLDVVNGIDKKYGAGSQGEVGFPASPGAGKTGQKSTEDATTLINRFLASIGLGAPAAKTGSTLPDVPWNPWNPTSKAEYEQLLYEFQQQFAPYVAMFRTYYPELTWNQLAAALTGAGGTPSMLPAGFSYLSEPPLDEDTGKPMKGYTGPGIYLVTSSGNVKRVMDDKQARKYFDLADQFQTAIFTFGSYFDADLDPETAAALAQFSPEMLAFQDALDRQAYEKALFEAAESLADKQTLSWRASKESQETMNETWKRLEHTYGHPGLAPLILSPLYLPPRDQLIKEWQEKVRGLVPPPPSRPSVSLPGIPGSGSPPTVPGWESKTVPPPPILPGDPLPSMPM